MDSYKRRDKSVISPSCCFFCAMKEAESPKRRALIANCFKKMPAGDDHESVLVLSSLFHMAMSQPDDPEFVSLGIFECMARLIQRAFDDEQWLLRDQNVFIPYYAAHVIGSYTMNKAEFAEKAVESGVVPPLIELLRGKKMSWVEQRVSVRALGHLASYESTFQTLSPEYEEEIVMLAMRLASTCVDDVYHSFVSVKGGKNRPKYQCDLLTRGVGGSEVESFRAEEWTSQLQCWSLYLLNCFANKERCLSVICEMDFLKRLSGMWGGLANHVSPSGVGLIRILCYSKSGRKKVAESRDVIESLCNLSRSSDDWQYMSIDCLLLLLKDLDTRHRVIDMAVFSLLDLVELRDLRDRSNLGDTITKILLLDHNKKVRKEKKTTINYSSKVQRALNELWDWKVERRRKERLLSEEKIEERRVLVGLIKQQAKHLYSLGDIKGASRKYSEALGFCPLKLRRERMVLYSNRAHCGLLLVDLDSAIRDSTRALCLSTPANSHRKSLWRRSQAYDLKGLARESLMDCIVFINGSTNNSGSVKNIPYYAARMISKQMDATWLLASGRSRQSSSDSGSFCKERMEVNDKMNKKGLSRIKEEEQVKRSSREHESATRNVKVPIK